MQCLKEKAYDLLLTDYHMPEMDGQALVKFVRLYSDQPALPVIMITTEQNAKTLVELEKCSLSTVCSKPFEPRVIADHIQQLLQNKKGQIRLFDLCFLVHDMFACFWIKFFDLKLFAHRAFVFGRGVEMTGACTRY